MNVALRCGIATVCLAAMVSNARSAEPKATQVYAVIDRLIKNGSVAGAQVAVGQASSPLALKSFGVRDVQGGKPVNDDTQFCIGSCSKMFAGAVLVSLATDKTVDLDAPIDRWLKGFASLKLVGGGTATRAPTLTELLCHRSGIYSQSNRLTMKQSRWIRDFEIPLSEAVTGIAQEPLSIEPGKRYAYSGAGYCVLGRVAEVAAGKSFDNLLARHVTQPLKLTRTTYFPAVDENNIAAGHTIVGAKLWVLPWTPHLLGKRHKLALVGGSLYAPARETAEFARMLLRKGRARNGVVLSPAEWKAMTAIRSPRLGGGYAFGLQVAADRKTGTLLSVSHGGALFGSYSFVAVDFRTGRFGVVNYTGRGTREIAAALKKWVSSTAGRR